MAGDTDEQTFSVPLCDWLLFFSLSKSAQTGHCSVKSLSLTAKREKQLQVVRGNKNQRICVIDNQGFTIQQVVKKKSLELFKKSRNNNTNAVSLSGY